MRDGAECDDHAGEPCGAWFGVKQKKRERLRGKNKLRSLFLFQKVNDRQKMVKKDKEKG